MHGGSRFGSEEDKSDVQDSVNGGKGFFTCEKGSEGLQDCLDVIHSRPFVL